MIPPKIPQSLLQQYRELHNQEKKYRARRDALRDQLMKLLGDGARVEAGDLDVRVLEYAQVTLSKANVVAALGQEHYDWLRGQVAPVLRTQLRVAGRKKGKGHFHKVTKSKPTCFGVPADDDWE